MTEFTAAAFLLCSNSEIKELESQIASIRKIVSTIYVVGENRDIHKELQRLSGVNGFIENSSEARIQNCLSENELHAAIVINQHEKIVRLSAESLQDELSRKQQAALKIRCDDCLGLSQWQARVIYNPRLINTVSNRAPASSSSSGDGKITSVRLRQENHPTFWRTQASELIVRASSNPIEVDALELARAYQALDDHASAKAWYECLAASERSQSPFDIWLAKFNLINSRLRDGLDRESIFADCCALYDEYPTRLEPLIFMSEHLRENGDIDSALALTDQAKQILEPSDGGYYFNMFYERLIDSERAECFNVLGDHRRVYNLCSRQLIIKHAHPKRDRLIKLRDDAYLKLAPVLPVESSHRNHFLIVVPFYNALDYLQACVDSIKQQDYADYEVVFVDDMSTDGGLAKVDLSGLQKHRIVVNSQKHDGLGNQLRVLDAHPEVDDIAVLLDGDDAFAHGSVLSRLNSIYNDSGCWLTYGQNRPTGGGVGVARPTLPPERISDLFSQTPFQFPIHLRTNRVGLFQKIKEQSPGYACLQDADGKIMSYSGDISSMRAMASLAGSNKIRYVSEILCDYTTANPASHHHIASHRQAENAAFVAGLPALEAVSSYRPGQDRATPSSKLLLLCFAGSDPKQIDSMLQQGKMPNLAKYFSHSAGLKCPRGFSSDSYWRSVFSGKLPGQHFMTNRRVSRLHSYRQLDAQVDRWAGSVQPFWNELAIDGCMVAALNPPEVKPQRVPNLTFSSDWFTHGPYWSPESQPSNLIQQLDEIFETSQKDAAQIESTWLATDEDLMNCFAQLERRQGYKVKATQSLLQRGGWDVLVSGFDFSHDVAHQFWHFHDKSHPDYRQPADGDPIEKMYEMMDRDIGVMMEHADGANAAVVTGLGFQANCSLNTILPEMLDQLEEHYRASQNIAPLAELAEPSARANKLFFCVENNPNAGAIRINLQGRESHGLVTKADYHALIKRLTDDLMAIKSTVSNQSMLSEVLVVANEFQGPYGDLLPDLLLIWNPNAALESYTSDLVQEVTYRPGEANVLDFRTADHDDSAAIYYNDRFAQYAEIEQDTPSESMAGVFKMIVEAEISTAS